MLKKIREESGLTQYEVADRLGITQQAVADMEKRNSTSINTALKLSKIYNKSVEEIFLATDTSNNCKEDLIQ